MGHKALQRRGGGANIRALTVTVGQSAVWRPVCVRTSRESRPPTRLDRPNVVHSRMNWYAATELRLSGDSASLPDNARPMLLRNGILVVGPAATWFAQAAAT
jgi:hypothetical protein